MTFPTVTTVTDDFNRADERPLTGGSWEAVGALGGTDPNAMLAVNGNQLQGHASTGIVSQHWNGTAGPDVESYITFATIATDEDFSGCLQVRLYVRLQGGGTATADGYAYMAELQGSFPNIRLYRLDNGVFTQLGDAFGEGEAVGPANGDRHGVECEGDQLRVYKWNSVAGWQQWGVRTDATYGAAGTAAVEMQDSVGRNDDWFYGTKIPQPDTPTITKPRAIARTRARGGF